MGMMARITRGKELADQARRAIAGATRAEPLRQAQAVVLSLDRDLSLKATAKVLELSVGWTSRLRNAFIVRRRDRRGFHALRGGRPP